MRIVDPPHTLLQVLSLLLQPRSLVVFEGDAYEDHLHTIHAAAVDTIGSMDHGPFANLDQSRAQLGDKVTHSTRQSLTLRRRRHMVSRKRRDDQ
jgi:hypothetical protein